MVALEEQDVVDNGQLPIAMMRLSDEKLSRIAIESDTTAISNYYFVAFDESRYNSNTTNYYIYKAIAGLIAAIVVALTYLIVVKISQ